MSIQAVNDFMQKVRRDGSFHGKFLSYLLDRKNESFNPQWVADFAAQEGFSFTLEDCDKAIQDKMQSGEMTREELARFQSGNMLAPGFLKIF